MTINERLLNATSEHKVDWNEFLKKSEPLEHLTGEERVKFQNELAEWVEATFPLRERIPPNREFSESEMNAVDVVFNDAINGSLGGASVSYEVLKNIRKLDLYGTNLDVGYIDEPEDSDYRKIASWKFVYAFSDEPDEAILEWQKKYNVGEYLCKFMEKEEPFRIWYSENPKELCGLYYLCSLLKDYSGDVYAVRVPERIRYKKERKYHPVYSTGQIDAENAGRIVETAVKLSSAEIKMYAGEWERLKQENALLRTVIAGKVISVGEDFYDSLILNHVPAKPVKEERVFGEVQGALPFIHQGWITIRIQYMIDKGYIEVVKEHEDPAKRLICRKNG